jgi:hypothetical protein
MKHTVLSRPGASPKPGPFRPGFAAPLRSTMDIRSERESCDKLPVTRLAVERCRVAVAPPRCRLASPIFGLRLGGGCERRVWQVRSVERGDSSRMVRMASAALKFGIRRSIKVTSGRCCTYFAVRSKSWAAVRIRGSGLSAALCRCVSAPSASPREASI